MADAIRAPRLLASWSSTGGRWLRIYIGVLLTVIGIASGTLIGFLLALPGIALLAGGAGDVSLLARLLGGPFAGDELRAQLGTRPAPLLPEWLALP